MEIGFVRKASTRQQLTWLWVLSILVLAAAWYAIVSSSLRSITDSAIAHIDRLLEQFQNEFSANVEEIDGIVNSLAINPAIKAYLTEPVSYRRHLVASELVDYFMSLSGLKPAVEDIAVLRLDGGKIAYYDLPEVQSRVAAAVADKPYASSLGMSDYGTTGKKLLIGCTVFDRSILNAQRSEDPKLGIVFAAVDPRSLSRNLSSISGIEGVRYVVYDEAGNEVIGNIAPQERQILDIVHRARAGGAALETPTYRVRTHPVPNLDGTIITVVDKSVLFGPVRRSLLFSAVILLSAVALLLAMYAVAVSSVVRPIDRLIAFLRDMRHDYMGQLGARISARGNRDTALLSTELNGMLAEIHRLTHELVENNSRLYQIEIAQKQSEIALLRSQINPHFLYNTLEVIRSIGVIDGSPDVEATARSLARIMRYSIKGYDNVPLAEELSVVRDYVQIQNVRFKGKFEAEYHLDEAALQWIVPKMCLEPVVENAFVHGLELLPGGGRLRIAAERRDAATLCVTVEDNGPGIDPARLEALNHELADGAAAGGNPAGATHATHGHGAASIGLANVNARIRLSRPGAECGIRVRSRAGKGTCVELLFPVGEARVEAQRVGEPGRDV